MKRVIKFRVWDKQRKQFAKQITTFKFDRSGDINLVVYLEKVNNTYPIYDNEKIYCNEFEVMLFTGLRDANKKDIYEGDVLTWKWNREYLLISDVFTICRKQIDFASRGIGNWELPSICEVVGNIYENPELLKHVENEK